MEKFELGNSGEKVSCMGLGTMYFGSKINDQVAFDLLDCYALNGGSFLDSANKYASWIPGFKGGESEMLVGKWMRNRGNRQEMFIASKVGFPYGDIPRTLKKEVMIAECEKSLQRLGVETIDLYYAHAFDPETPIEETMEAFFQLKKQGKIRYAGASNFYAWQLCEANLIASSQGWEGFSCVQQRHTYLEPLLRTDFGNQLLLTPELEQYCLQKQLSIIAYSPLLGGAYAQQEGQVPEKYKSSSATFQINQLHEVAEELKVTANAVVLAWMIQCSPAVIPLVTASSVSHLTENLQALTIRLSDNQMTKLNAYTS